MGAYLARRMLLMIPTLLGMTMVVFFVMAAAPGDMVDMVMSQSGEMQAGDRRARLRYVERRYGLDRSLLVQYGRWLNKVSPFGFLTSDQIIYTSEQETSAKAIIGKRIEGREHRQIIFEVARTVARNEMTDLGGATDRLLDRFEDDPRQVLAIGAELGVSLSNRPPPEDASDRLQRRYRLTEAVRTAEGDALNAAAMEFLQEEVVGKSQVLFSTLGFKAPDFGESFYHRRPVKDMIVEVLPITLLLNLLSIPLVYTLAILSGVYAAKYQGRAFDIGSGVTLLGLWSIPTIWAGVMLIGFLANEQYIQWFPTSGLHDIRADAMPFLPHTTESGFERGWLLDTLWRLILPVICLSYAGFAFLSKLSRGAVLENLRADFVRTARAKGVGESDVLWHHVFRNSLLPLITVAAFVVPALLSGSVIVERIFTIKGMGNLMIEAIEFKDKEVVLAVTLISGMLSMVAFLIADLLYTVADPRVSYE
jgi:microcin C transport system permease protein